DLPSNFHAGVALAVVANIAQSTARAARAAPIAVAFVLIVSSSPCAVLAYGFSALFLRTAAAAPTKIVLLRIAVLCPAVVVPSCALMIGETRKERMPPQPV